MLSAVYTVVVCLCVCVCVSVTLRYCIKTAKRRITQIMPHDRFRTSFQTRCFVVAGFLLTSASRGPSAIVELLVVKTERLVSEMREQTDIQTATQTRGAGTLAFTYQIMVKKIPVYYEV